MLEHVRRHHLDKIFADFFRWKPTSLLIRGEPGAGKTTLALELLNYTKHIYRGYYISTRVSYNKLLDQFPWTRELLAEESVLSPFKQYSKEIAVMDVRLGSISSIVELVMKAVMKKRAFIILDSWDALAKEADVKERLKVEKTMVSLADANDSFLVFISEEPELSTVAYLVDGVVTTEHYNDLRSLRLDKMRGMSIYDKHVFYTLEQSHFTPIYKPPNISFHTLCRRNGNKLFEPIKHKQISTGNRYLDEAIGGIGKGNIVFIETDLNRDRRVLDLLLLDMILNNLRNDGSAIIVNTPDKPYTSILKQIKPYCSYEDLERLLILSADDTLQDLPYLATISYSDLKASCNTLVCNKYPELKKKSKTCLLTLDLGMCETQLTNNQLELVKQNIIRLERAFRENGDIIIFINTTGYKSMPLVQTTMDIHLKLYTKEGATFIETIKPHNGIYGIEVDTNKGYPTFLLRRML
jgi:KaiC/GvpD/RAD55 family RecA-like ATPase